MQSQLYAQKNKINNLKSQVDRIPDVEAELSRLNRDYEVNQQKYQDLLTRLESAKLSEEASMTNDDLKYQIIEPPLVPTQPISPNRPFIYCSSFIVSFRGCSIFSSCVEFL